MNLFDTIAGMGHEQLVVCHDKSSGYRGIIAIHDTTLGPALGGTRFWQYRSDEEAIIDGASPLRLFFSVIFPLLRPAIVTVIVVTSVAIYNDFANPLYFLPGEQNVTAQLTLYSFTSQFINQWNLLFADVIIITIIPLIMFIFFQRQIVAGMAAGAVKG